MGGYVMYHCSMFNGTPAMQWAPMADGSFRSGVFTIRQARVGLTWELWRAVPGRPLEALGCGPREELARLAQTLAPAREVEDDGFVAAYLAKAAKPRRTLTQRAIVWLNS